MLRPAVSSSVSSGERSVRAPVLVPDAVLELYAEAYLATPGLAALGISFEQFLAATPEVAATGRERFLVLALDVYRHQAALERAGASCANGRFVEKLRHRRHRRSYRDFAVMVEM